MNKKEIDNAITLCKKQGMRDPASIYQFILDTVPSALSNTETEQYVFKKVNE